MTAPEPAPGAAAASAGSGVPGRPGWWARLGLRWRLMLVGLTGLGGSLAAAAIVLYAALATTLPGALADEAGRAAKEVAALAGEGRVPDPVPVAGALVVQVLDEQGRVIGASALADRLTPLATPDELARVAAGERVTVPGSRSGLSGPLLLAVASTGRAAAPPSLAGPIPGSVGPTPGSVGPTPGSFGTTPSAAGATPGRRTVVAAVPTGDSETTLAQLRTTLLIGVPLLLTVLGAVAWRVIASALAPVEQLRRGAERIGAAGAWGAGGARGSRGAGVARGVGRARGGTEAGPDLRAAAGDGPGERLPVPAARDEIHALATTLNEMLARLEHLHVRQRSLLDDAAHELRSPLATMLTQLEVAQRIGEGDGLPDELLPQVRRLATLVEDLLVLARTDSGTLPVRRDPVDLRGLVVEVADRYAAARVPVTVAVSPGEAASTASAASAGPAQVLVSGSRDDILRALTNLVDNAVRHARTAVTLRLVTSPTAVQVHVVDDGLGIPPEQRERVFDRFTRLDDARDRDSGGTGLGLPIARELLHRNGAEIRMTDAEPGINVIARWSSPVGTG